jgi:hypothetical protein
MTKISWDCPSGTPVIKRAFNLRLPWGFIPRDEVICVTVKEKYIPNRER